MIPRYTLAEMGAIWSEETRFERMLEVELAVAEAQARRGLVPGDAIEAMRARARVDIDRIHELERTTDHEVVAFVDQLAERIGPEGRFLHLGLTSSDVLDTALAMQLRSAGERLAADLDRLIGVVVGRAREHASTVLMGRTHSVHAEPTTLGLKLAGWAFELDRARSRLAAAFAETATGKLSGPVGTYSHLDPELEADVLGRLGLAIEQAATQVVARDRHAAVLAAIAVAGGTLERIATEVRNLQHTEIGELAEPFRAGQAGSSAMPHKRNPIVSERIAGLARLLRGYAQAGFENEALWHERDISHSSAERVALPDATILLDYMLVKTIDLVAGMTVDAVRMRRNIDSGLGLWASSRLLLALVETGLERQVAYRIVQRDALLAADEGRALRTVVESDPDVTSRLDEAGLAACFDEAHLLRNVETIIGRLARLEEPSPVRGGARG
jgi:adenylosuccinate lyase